MFTRKPRPEDGDPQQHAKPLDALAPDDFVRFPSWGFDTSMESRPGLDETAVRPYALPARPADERSPVRRRPPDDRKRRECRRGREFLLCQGTACRRGAQPSRAILRAPG